MSDLLAPSRAASDCKKPDSATLRRIAHTLVFFTAHLLRDAEATNSIALGGLYSPCGKSNPTVLHMSNAVKERAND